jgi:Mn-dependent DtxR family transcriptional regulator
MASAQTSPDGMDTTILSLLAEKESINTSDLAVQLDIDHQLIIGAVKSLHSRGDVSRVYTLTLRHTYSEGDFTYR